MQINYDLEPEEYMRYDVLAMSPQERREFAYYLWSCFPDNIKVMTWRRERVLSVIKKDDVLDVNEH